MSKSSSPNVPLFKNFQNTWPKLNKSNFVPGIEIEYIREKISNNTMQEILQFSITTLKNDQQPREDYREFLELIVIFLGGTPPKNIRFRAPGAFHHARWMAKAIYCLKIYLFKNQFVLTADEEVGIRDICVFLVNIYIKAWIRAPVAAEAPCQDLTLLNNLYEYRSIDEQISNVALKKFCNHLWYLSTEAVALAFFDETIDRNVKLRMVEALNIGTDETSKKYKISPDDVKNYVNRGIEYFISEKTLKFFERFSIPTEFLKKDPDSWKDDDGFKLGLSIIKKLKVVNDTAERGIKLIQDYNHLLSKNEEEKQYILQIISEHRKQFPDVTKESLRET